MGSHSAQAAQVVRVGIYDNNPLVEPTPSGGANGFYIDLLQAIAHEEGWQLQYVPVIFADGLDRLEKGELDLMTAVAYSEERAARFDFTQEAVLINWGQVYLQKGFPARSYIDLRAKTIAMCRDDTYTIKFTSLMDDFQVPFRSMEVEDYSHALAAVSEGLADACVISRLFGDIHAKDFNVAASDMIFNPIELRFALPKNAPVNSALIAALDNHLKAFKADESSLYYQAVDRYLGVKRVARLPDWLIGVLAAVAGMLFLFVGIAFLLRFQVRARTVQLSRRNEELQAEVAHRARVEQNLREAQERLTLLVNALPDLVILKDPTGRYLSTNLAFRSFLGKSQEEIEGKTAADLFPAATAQSLEEAGQSALGASDDPPGWNPHRVEVVLQRKDGAQATFEVIHAVVRGEGGIILGLIGIARDISERKQSERLKEDLLYAVSHEMKTPLQVMLAAQELYAGQPATEFLKRQAQFWELLQRNLSRLRQLLDNFLDSQKLTHETLALQLEPLDLRRIMEETMEECQSSAKLRSVSFNVKCPDSLPMISADPKLLRQVFTNLYSNAVRFSPKGGRILTVFSQEGQSLEVRIADDGPGIPEEEMPRLFERFYRPLSSQQRASSGTGLGLYLCRVILEGHGGAIRLQSQPGQGTTVIFTLPCGQI